MIESENWRAYRFLIEGVPVEYRDTDGQVRTARAWLVDWENLKDNDLIAVNQFSIAGPKRTRRPDVLLFVNGLPLAVFELKRAGKQYATLSGAYRQLQTYRSQIPEVYKWNQVAVVSDGLDALAGSFSAPWNHWAAWKTIDGSRRDPKNVEGLRIPPVEVLTRGMFRLDVFFDLCRNFVATFGEGIKTRKAVAKYHQYWAVNKAVDQTLESLETDGRIGVVWHTQGSGKSLEMAYYAGKVMRHPGMENPTLVVLTDRNDLDEQLFDETFAACPALLCRRRRSGRVASRPPWALPAASRAGSSSPRSRSSAAKEDREAGAVPAADRPAQHRGDRRRGPPLAIRLHRRLRPQHPRRAARTRPSSASRARRSRRRTAPPGGLRRVHRRLRHDPGRRGRRHGQMYYEPRLAKVEMPAEARDAIDDEFDDATDGSEDEIASG